MHTSIILSFLNSCSWVVIENEKRHEKPAVNERERTNIEKYGERNLPYLRRERTLITDELASTHDLAIVACVASSCMHESSLPECCKSSSFEKLFYM